MNILKQSSVASLLLLCGTLLPTYTYAMQSADDSFFDRIGCFQRGKTVLQVGGFSAAQGQSQHIGIDSLIGDQFTLRHRQDQNALFGFGYYFTGMEDNRFNILYGLNAFYFLNNPVKGNVIQEDIFNNLSYSYHIYNYPIYAASKAIVHLPDERFDVTFDFGIGPNVVQTTHFHENSLDNGVTLPDHIFKGHTKAAFSTSVGVGIAVNNFIPVPFECGYRFFYLGQGRLAKTNNQVTNTLSTRHGYANALLCSVTI